MATKLSKIIHHLGRTAAGADRDQLADGQLVDCFLAVRDEAAFAELVRRHGPMVLGLCRRILRDAHDAEDAFQATFLVLARKAGSITRRETVGGWLHGVACKTALKARAAKDRRLTKERQAGAMPGQTVDNGDSNWEELLPMLDQELSRLPDKYRVPIVLCDLEGKSRKEAAALLGCPEGTLSGRLSRAHVLLAKRLARFKSPLASAVGTLALAQQATASVPASLIGITTKAATAFAVGQAASGLASAKVAALAEGVVKAMLLSKLKIGAVLLVLGTMCAGSAALTYDTLAGQPQGTQQVEKNTKAADQAAPMAEKNRKEPLDQKAPGERWLQAARRPKLSPQEKKAYEQIARLHLCAFPQMDHWGTLMIVPPGKDATEPTDVLYRMGLEVLPQLAEALDDHTPTRTVTTVRKQKKVWQVNDLAARLIVAITARDFVVGKQPNDFPEHLRDLNVLGIRDLNEQPGSIAALQKVVLDWYAHNRKKALSERKVGDVDDGWFRNRFDAIEWLGQNKSAAGRLAIAKRVDAILGDKKLVEHTLLYSELSLCSLALGQIGDKASLPQVHKICQYLADDHGLPSGGRWQVGSDGPQTLFEAFHGLALLGEKDTALRQLQAVYDNNQKGMDPGRQRVFQEQLAQARRW